MNQKPAIGRATRCVVFAASAVALGVAFGACAQTGIEAQERTEAPRAEATIAIRPVPQEAVNRYAKLNTALQPSAKSWIETQARIELQRPSLDVASLEAAVRARFSGAGSAAPHASSGAGIPAGADIEAMAFIVLMQATNDQNQDLQEIMNEVQAQTKAKQALRDLLNQVQRDVASNANQQAKEVCATAECRSIAQQIAQVESLTSQTGHPVRFNASNPPTYGQLRQAQATANESLDSLSDMSQSMQMKIQMEQSEYSQIMEAISNVEKKMTDTSNSIIQNMK